MGIDSGVGSLNIGQTTSANAASVVIASDQTAVAISGTVTAAAQPGVDLGDVTINNSTGASAVNIQDGGNTITVDGTVAATQSGTWTVQPGNTANTTAWKVDGSAVTQPVSGTVAATQSGTWTAQTGGKSYTASGNSVSSLGPFDMTGQATAVIQIESTYAATWTVYGYTSLSGATRIPLYQLGDGTGWTNNGGLSLTNGIGIFAVDVTGFTAFVIVITPYTSGTLTFNISTAPAAQFVNVLNDTASKFQTTTTPITLTKGTQGATGFSTQDLKDAGRTSIIYSATNVASGSTTTETAITLVKSAGTGATSSAGTFVVTNGKRFRITSISCATRGNSTATAQTTTFNLRLNTAGAVTTSSTPILMSVRSATPATSLEWDRVTFPIPDGYEILGDGTLQIGMTAAATFVTNAPTWDVTIIGFEY